LFQANGATLRAPGNTQRPDATGTPEVLGGIGPGKLWFDTSVFSAPAQDTWGNVPRNGLLDGPGYRNVDLTIAKLFTLPRGMRGEFRIDAFNAFNMPNFQFDEENRTLGNAVFGQITRVIDNNERLVRFGVKLTF
jgi:hypothetical protein